MGRTYERCDPGCRYLSYTFIASHSPVPAGREMTQKSGHIHGQFTIRINMKLNDSSRRPYETPGHLSKRDGTPLYRKLDTCTCTELSFEIRKAAASLTVA